MTSRTNLVLVGPMGAGKTSVGKLLAQHLKLEFVDADRELEARCGADIPWIFDIEGEAGFRARETEVLADLCHRQGILLATGGGAVLLEENRVRLRQAGIVIYLSASEDQIYQRVSKDSHRPLLMVDNPRQAISRIMAQREPLYRDVANLVVSSSDNESPASMANRLYKQLVEKYPQQFGP